MTFSSSSLQYCYCIGAGIPAVQGTMISPTIETVLQSTQASHHQHQQVTVEATARQPCAPFPQLSHHLPSQQHTKPWSHTHDSLSPQKQEVEPQGKLWEMADKHVSIW